MRKALLEREIIAGDSLTCKMTKLSSTFSSCILTASCGGISRHCWVTFYMSLLMEHGGSNRRSDKRGGVSVVPSS